MNTMTYPALIYFQMKGFLPSTTRGRFSFRMRKCRWHIYIFTLRKDLAIKLRNDHTSDGNAAQVMTETDSMDLFKHVMYKDTKKEEL